jgi:phosphate starvation-inducible PhoH-like protein
MDLLPGVDGVAFSYFQTKDVVRHPLVQRIVRAYEQRQQSSQSNHNEQP